MNGVNGLKQNSATKFVIPGVEIIYMHIAAGVIPCLFTCQYYLFVNGR